MRIENPTVIRPQIHPECPSCQYAERVIAQAEAFFSSENLGFELKCTETLGGGSFQVEPGAFVDFRDRWMRITPQTPREDDFPSRLEGGTVGCPHDLQDIAEQHPDFPWLESVGTTRFGQEYRYKLKYPPA